MTVTIELDDQLAALLRQTNQSLPQAVREMIVLEWYRRGSISSEKAAELLGLKRLELIQHAADLGLPFFAMTPDEWVAEKAAIDAKS